MSTSKKTKNIIAFFVVAMVLIFGLRACLLDSELSDMRKAPYKVANSQQFGNSMRYHIVTPGRYSKDTLIELLRSIKNDSNIQGELMIFYANGVMNYDSIYSSAAYLPNCIGCNTDEDAAGDSLEFRQLLK